MENLRSKLCDEPSWEQVNSSALINEKFSNSVHDLVASE